jgi:magnesium chelatase family protein
MMRAAFRVAPCAENAEVSTFKMLFKTISASVYGIDAYLVEVEVDVGSARMQDFNVVGLPDNAVKESRERIKSALRNCGYEFPYGRA